MQENFSKNIVPYDIQYDIRMNLSRYPGKLEGEQSQRNCKKVKKIAGKVTEISEQFIPEKAVCFKFHSRDCWGQTKRYSHLINCCKHLSKLQTTAKVLCKQKFNKNCSLFSCKGQPCNDISLSFRWIEGTSCRCR